MTTPKKDAPKTATFRERTLLIADDADDFRHETLEIALDEDGATFVVSITPSTGNEQRSVSVRISPKDVLAIAARVQTFPFRKETP